MDPQHNNKRTVRKRRRSRAQSPFECRAPKYSSRPRFRAVGAGPTVLGRTRRRRRLQPRRTRLVHRIPFHLVRSVDCFQLAALFLDAPIRSVPLSLSDLYGFPGGNLFVAFHPDEPKSRIAAGRSAGAPGSPDQSARGIGVHQDLEMLKALCDHHGLKAGLSADIEQLAQPTEPKTLVSELKDRLPEST